MFTVWPFKYLLDFSTSNWTPDVQGLSEIGLPANTVAIQTAELEKCLGFFF